MLSEDGDGFVHFLVQQRRIRLKVEHREQLRVLNFEQHSRNFTRKLGVHALNVRVEPFAQHLFLFLGWCASEHGSGELFGVRFLCWRLLGSLLMGGDWIAHVCRVGEVFACSDWTRAGIALESVHRRNSTDAGILGSWT